MRCPFCDIKANAEKKKIKYPYNGEHRCGCGAWLDRGQMSMTVNGYRGVYDGAVDLIREVVEEFKQILDYYDVDLKNEEFKPMISVYTSSIIERLFITGEGGTSKGNFAMAIGVDYGREDFSLVDDQEEQDGNQKQ